MELSRQLLKDFAEVTAGDNGRQESQYLRGTIKNVENTKYVKIDGSQSLTPLSEVVDVDDGDRVLVLIDNHEATVLGNLTFPPSARKEQEAIDKAEDAQISADDAIEKAETAKTLAQSAGDKADAAVVDATNASASANEAKQSAQEAITSATTAGVKADEAKNLATTAGQNAATAREEAALAQNAATAAQGEVTRIEGVVTGVKGDIDTALKEVADQAADLQATKETLEVTYAKKTEVSDVQAALTTEISKKVGELQTTVSQTYAAKNDVVAMEGRLQSQITQTSGEISSVVGKVEQLESDTTEAQKKVDEALEKSAAAQVAAGQAQANATAAQTAADAAKVNADNATKKANEAVQNAANAAATAAEADRKVSAAKTDLDEAKVNLENTMNRVGATEQEIADAQQKVDAAQAAVTQAQKDAAEATAAANNAQNAANKAQTDATEAQNAATNAQKKADNAATAAGNAQAAADKAQQDVAALTKRVTSAETSITQNAEQIKLAANKTEEIGTKLDNLQVGGRNYLIGTNKDYKTFNLGQYSAILSTRKLSDLNLKVGDYITASCDLKVPPNAIKGGKIRIQFFNNDADRPNYYGEICNIGEEKRLKATVYIDSKLLLYQRVDLIIESTNTSIAAVESGIQSRHEKLEIGNMMTDWSPAPEDQQSQIDGINNNLSNNYYSKTQTDAAIKVAADNVTTTVRKEVTTEITNVNNKVDNISIGDENLINLSEIKTYGAAIADTRNYIKRGEVIFTRSDKDIYSGIYFDFYNDSKPETYYVFSYDITALGSQPFSTIRGHMDTGFQSIKCYVDGVDTGKSYQERYTFSDSSVRKHHVEVYIKLLNNMTNDRRIFIQPNTTVQESEKYKIENLKIVEGNKYTNGWSPAPSDQQLQIDNIQVGGRNILRNTAFKTLDFWGGNNYRIVTDDRPSEVSKNNNTVAATATRTDYQYLNGISYNQPLVKAGKEYTISFWAKAERNIGVTSESGAKQYYANVTTEWQYYSGIITFATDNRPLYIYPASDTNVTLYINSPKLELGNKATDWTPAPEDMATAEQAQQAQNDANEANGKADATEHRVSVAESTIKQLSDSISMLVTDSNGSSMMTQTSDGWTFNIGSITDAINSATNNIDNLSGSLSQTNNVVNNLNQLANDLSKKTAYINMTTDETGAPCIELGKSGNAFKVRITNTSVDFIEGSSKIAYVSNQALFIEKAIIKSELQVGETRGFIWKTRSNGNMGLRWFG